MDIVRRELQIFRHILPNPTGWPCHFTLKLNEMDIIAIVVPGTPGYSAEIKYQDCSDSDQMCYNGGKCILGLSDIYGNDQLYCDCSEAIDEHGVVYVGKYCEVPKTKTCDDAGDVFCVNGGWCKEDYANYPRRPCHCGTQHEGPHCEFDAGAVPKLYIEVS